MTLSQFIAKWEGKGADWDNAYGFQCVDLFRFYHHEVVGGNQPRGVGGAWEFWGNYESDLNLHLNYTKVPNTPEGIAPAGSVIIWNKKMGGGYGHIAICISADLNTLTVLEQDGLTRSVARKRTYNYSNVLGWLIPKKAQNEAPGGSMYKGYDLTNAESMKVAVDVLVRVQSGEFVDKSVHEEMIKLKDRYRSERNKAREERDALQKQLDVVIPKLNKVVAENTILKDEAKENVEEMNALVQRIDELEIELSQRGECKKCEELPISTPEPRVPRMTLIDYILKLLRGER